MLHLEPALPLLEHLAARWRVYERRPFAGCAVLAVQHLLGSTASLLRAIEGGGASPDAFFVVGKAYSSHPGVVARLKDLGYRVEDAIEGFSDGIPYDRVLEQVVHHTLRTLISERLVDRASEPRVLLIDDAGKAIRALHEEYPHVAQYFRCVEQTTRGVRSLQGLDLRCPVVNVARSEAKLLYESPLIAKSMVEELAARLDTWRLIFQLRNRRALLLGYGAVGEKVAEELSRREFEVLVFDRDPTRRARAAREGYRLVSRRRDGLPEAGLIVGCTGTDSLPTSELKAVAQGSLLVNMASSDLEFGAWRLRPTGRVIHTSKSDFGFPSLTAWPWQCLYEVSSEGRTFYLANGGFPVDFSSGAVDPIPAESIQLTRALLFGAAFQALETSEPGLFELNSDLQEQVMTQYLGCRNSGAPTPVRRKSRGW